MMLLTWNGSWTEVNNLNSARGSGGAATSTEVNHQLVWWLTAHMLL